jgi:hypothetical protein
MQKSPEVISPNMTGGRRCAGGGPSGPGTARRPARSRPPVLAARPLRPSTPWTHSPTSSSTPNPHPQPCASTAACSCALPGWCSRATTCCWRATRATRRCSLRRCTAGEWGVGWGGWTRPPCTSACAGGQKNSSGASAARPARAGGSAAPAAASCAPLPGVKGPPHPPCPDPIAWPHPTPLLCRRPPPQGTPGTRTRRRRRRRPRPSDAPLPVRVPACSAPPRTRTGASAGAGRAQLTRCNPPAPETGTTPPGRAPRRRGRGAPRAADGG